MISTNATKKMKKLSFMMTVGFNYDGLISLMTAQGVRNFNYFLSDFYNNILKNPRLMVYKEIYEN